MAVPSRVAVLCVLGACATPHVEAPRADAAALLPEPCPAGATAMGWDRGSSSAAWCEDRRGRLQGATAVRAGASTWIGHYRDGVADGVFSGHEGRAVYVRGLLDGPCTFGHDMVTFRAGKLDGPFEWAFGDWCDDFEIIGDNPRWSSVAECFDADVPRGTVTGTFRDLAATGTLAVSSHGSTREIALEPGVAVELSELSAQGFDELLGPQHRWNGWPKCGYDNNPSFTAR